MDSSWERGIEFAFYHSLVDDNPETVAPALEALGRISACWARMEHHVDALIIQVNKPEHSEELFEEHPISFSRKLRVLSSWFNRYEPLAAYRKDMAYLTSRLSMLSAESDPAKNTITRNLLLHAIPASFDPAKGSITFHHMKFQKDGNIRSRHIDISLESLATFADMVQMANTFLGTITKEMFTEEGYERLRTP